MSVKNVIHNENNLRRCYLLIFLISCNQNLSAQETYPGSRGSASFIYHPQSEAMLLISTPVIPDSTRSDVWKWNGKNWLQVEANGPGSRDFFPGALNKKNGKLYFFGGLKQNDDSRKGDMWAFDGIKWSRVITNNIGTRDHHNMVYIDHLDAFLVYGGNNNGYPNFDSTTWLLKNNKFTKLDIPGPGPRWHYGMVYDKHRKKVILYGGGEKPDEHWEFDGSKWEKIINKENPGRRLYHHMAYNEDSRKTILHGGWPNQNPRDPDNYTPRTNWEWDGNTWKKIAEEPIFTQALGYDAKRKVIVAYGLTGKRDESNIALWELRNNQWLKVADYGKWNTTEYIKKWASDHPDDVNGLIKYADMLLWQEKQFPEAEAAYKKLEKVYPQNNPTTWTELAFILAVQGKPAEAESYLSKLNRAGLGNKRMYARLAGRLAQEKKLKEAIPYYQKVIEMGAGGNDFYNLACAYARMGEKDKSFDALNKAIQNGYNAKKQYEDDSDLESLKSDVRWNVLLEKTKN